MSSESLTDENLHELLFYLNNVKLIDKLRMLQVDVVILVIWALLALLASLSETFLNISTGADFTVIIWILSISFGAILTIFLKEQLYLTARPKFEFVNKVLVAIVVVGILVAIIFENIIIIKEIIFPTYSILLAIYSYSVLQPYYTTHAEIFEKNRAYIIPLFCVMSGLLNISGSVLEDVYPELFNSILGGQYFAAFESVIFTVFLSASLLLIARNNHNYIRKYVDGIEVSD